MFGIRLVLLTIVAMVVSCGGGGGGGGGGNVTPPPTAQNTDPNLTCDPTLIEIAHDATEFPAPTCTATDAKDNNQTVQDTLEIVSGAVDYGVPGDYVLRYQVRDSDGATASVDVTVRVLDPPVTNTEPTITLEGENPWTRQFDEPCNDPPAVIYADDSDTPAELASRATVVSNVQCALPGSYQITYSTVDSEGLASDTVTRDVVIEAEPTQTEFPALYRSHVNIGLSQIGTTQLTYTLFPNRLKEVGGANVTSVGIGYRNTLFGSPDESFVSFDGTQNADGSWTMSFTPQVHSGFRTDYAGGTMDYIELRIGVATTSGNHFYVTHLNFYDDSYNFNITQIAPDAYMTSHALFLVKPDLVYPHHERWVEVRALSLLGCVDFLAVNFNGSLFNPGDPARLGQPNFSPRSNFTTGIGIGTGDSTFRTGCSGLRGTADMQGSLVRPQNHEYGHFSSNYMHDHNDDSVLDFASPASHSHVMQEVGLMSGQSRYLECDTQSCTPRSLDTGQRHLNASSLTRYQACISNDFQDQWIWVGDDNPPTDQAIPLPDQSDHSGDLVWVDETVAEQYYGTRHCESNITSVTSMQVVILDAPLDLENDPAGAQQVVVPYTLQAQHVESDNEAVVVASSVGFKPIEAEPSLGVAFGITVISDLSNRAP